MTAALVARAPTTDSNRLPVTAWSTRSSASSTTVARADDAAKQAALLVGAVLASGEFPDAVTVAGAAVVAAGNVALARILLRSARA